MANSSNTKEVTSETKIKLSVKEFIGVFIFIISIGISIGGFLKVIGDVKEVSTKLDNLSKDVNDIKIQNGQIKTLIMGKDAIK